MIKIIMTSIYMFMSCLAFSYVGVAQDDVVIDENIGEHIADSEVCVRGNTGRRFESGKMIEADSAGANRPASASGVEK